MYQNMVGSTKDVVKKSGMLLLIILSVGFKITDINALF